jgi:hypothetical protein
MLVFQQPGDEPATPWPASVDIGDLLNMKLDNMKLDKAGLWTAQHISWLAFCLLTFCFGCAELSGPASNTLLSGYAVNYQPWRQLHGPIRAQATTAAATTTTPRCQPTSTTAHLHHASTET